MSLHDEIREQQKKLKGQGFKAHWDYFWEYYKIHTIVAIVAIILIAVLVRDITNNKPYAIYVEMLNSAVPEAESTFETKFAEYAKLNTEEYNCFVDTTSSYDTEVINEMTIATSEKIMANISAAELDVMTADTHMFSYYAHQDVFKDLREVFDEDFLNKYQDKIFYVDRGLVDYIASDDYQNLVSGGTYDENNKYAVMAKEMLDTGKYPETPVEEMADPEPVGFILDDSSIIKETNAYYGNRSIAGVVINTKRLDTAKAYIEFLLQ